MTITKLFLTVSFSVFSLSTASMVLIAPNQQRHQQQVEEAAGTSTSTVEEVAVVTEAYATSNTVCTSDEIRSTHPTLCRMLTRLEQDPEELSKDITQWARLNGLLVGEDLVSTTSVVGFSSKSYDQQPMATSSSTTFSSQLPVVFAHGMGDSCFNDGMIHITNHTSLLLGGVYTTCIPTGDTQAEDTSNGYFLNMDASVDVFASKVAVDPHLQDGFHAIGFSQGNNVIRGYITRFVTTRTAWYCLTRRQKRCPLYSVH
jgi:hypothetical protein